MEDLGIRTIRSSTARGHSTGRCQALQMRLVPVSVTWSGSYGRAAVTRPAGFSRLSRQYPVQLPTRQLFQTLQYTLEQCVAHPHAPVQQPHA